MAGSVLSVAIDGRAGYVMSDWADRDGVNFTSIMFTQSYRSTFRLLKKAPLQCTAQIPLVTPGDLEASRCAGCWLGLVSCCDLGWLHSAPGFLLVCRWRGCGGQSNLSGQIHTVEFDGKWLLVLFLCIGAVYLDARQQDMEEGRHQGKRNKTGLSLCQHLCSTWISLIWICGQLILFSCQRAVTEQDLTAGSRCDPPSSLLLFPAQHSELNHLDIGFRLGKKKKRSVSKMLVLTKRHQVGGQPFHLRVW